MSPIKSFVLSAVTAASTLGFAVMSTSVQANGPTFRLNGPQFNGPIIQGPIIQGPVVQGPILQGPSSGPVHLGQPVAVTLASGRKLQVK